MKKVFQLISSMNIGGAETMVKDYALLLDKNEIELKIIAMDKCYNSANEQVLKAHGIEIIYLTELLYPADKKLNPFQKVMRFVSRYYYFRKIMLTEKPDVLHCHLHMGLYLKVLPLKKLKTKLLYTVHNIPERFFSENKKDKPRYKEYLEAKRLIKKHNMHLIALHDEMNRELRTLFKTENVITVNNGIVLDRFNKSLYDRSAKRKELGLDNDAFIIGHVGRFHEQKNHERIIEIFRDLLRIKENARLILVGNGDLRKNIKNQLQEWRIEDKVLFLENRKDIPALMAIMDVFLFPSRWEGFGNVLIEAQSTGIKCVISDKVPEGVKITDYVKAVPLDEKNDKWIEEILRPIDVHVDVNGLKDFNMINSVKKLQSIYLE